MIEKKLDLPAYQKYRGSLDIYGLNIRFTASFPYILTTRC